MRVLAVVLLSLVAATFAAPAGAKPRALRAFTSCPQLLDYAKTHGTRAVRTGWVPTAMAIDGPQPSRVPTNKGGPTTSPSVTQDSAASSPEGSGGGETFSTTNVQEAGVDEPDVVKTDGTTIYAIANGVLHAVDAKSAEPRLLGTLKLDDGYGHEILLHGKRLLVVQNAWLETATAKSSSSVASYPVSGRPVTRLTEIDVSDPAAMKVLRTERDDGEYVSARMTGDTARVVIAARAPVVYGIAEATGNSENAVVAKRLRQVRRATLAAWRPYSFFRDRRRPKRATMKALTRCQDVRHTARFSGLDTMTILTIDMARGLPSVDAEAVMSDAQIIYGSPTRLYVATQRWLSPQAMNRSEAPATTTQIHEFDTSRADRTPYVASGSVKGYLLSQFAMSEHEGVLRVASTETPQWWPGGSPEDDPGSSVTTLDTATMAELGRVGGLGKGERIYAVRFIGDQGYVVTFRQVDPLYVLDLSKPSAPAVTGELKIAGYSAYLHPVGKDLILGVGQDAGPDGRTSGTQLSLFDVSDPAKPTRIAQHRVGQNSSSTAEFDHHAFLYWPKTKLVVVPLQLYDYESGTDPFVGAIGFRVEREAITEVGRIAHPHDEYSLWDVQRATVVDDRLFTLSSAGVLSSALDTLASGPFVSFPSVPVYTPGYGCGGPADGGPEPAMDCAATTGG